MDGWTTSNLDITLCRIKYVANWKMSVKSVVSWSGNKMSDLILDFFIKIIPVDKTGLIFNVVKSLAFMGKMCNGSKMLKESFIVYKYDEEMAKPLEIGKLAKAISFKHLNPSKLPIVKWNNQKSFDDYIFNRRLAEYFKLLIEEWKPKSIPGFEEHYTQFKHRSSKMKLAWFQLCTASGSECDLNVQIVT